jgi:CDP-diacylglycerol--glycerol-3-phosphate 3-phosphatidyltransferase
MISCKDLLTLPNSISLFRLLLAPVMLLAGYFGHPLSVKILFSVAVISDLFDGILARALELRTELGAKLDTIADLTTYLALYFCFYFLWPGFVHQAYPFFAAGLIIYTIAFSFALLKFRRFPSYHSIGGKLSAVLMALSILCWFIGGPAFPFFVAISISLIAGIEEIIITALLPRLHTNVPTCWHAYRMRELYKTSDQ